MYNIVLVSAGNFQPYIIDNITQLKKLNHHNIHVITNKNFFDKFKGLDVNLVDVGTLNDVKFRSTLDGKFRNGFWQLTSMRFFYILSLMKKQNLENVFHLENDVPIYHSLENVLQNVDNTKIFVPFDAFKRNIASIMYIPNANILEQCLQKYDGKKTDMQNFVKIRNETNLIDHFPIFIEESSTNQEVVFVSKNFSKFKYIFDAAAIGQYLGGVDPRNKAGDTTGFVNETCVVKYNQYKFHWEDYKPYININGVVYPIFNLHIHSKNVKKFISIEKS